jgi:hypothetical protein
MLLGVEKTLGQTYFIERQSNRIQWIPTSHDIIVALSSWFFKGIDK